MGTPPIRGYAIEPLSETRHVDAQVGILEQLIFRISPGASRYSGSANAGMICIAIKNAKQAVTMPVSGGVMAGCGLRLTMDCALRS